MRFLYTKSVSLPLLPVAVKLVLDIATDIDVLDTSHIGLISGEKIRVSFKQIKSKSGEKTNDCGKYQTTNGLFKFLSE